MFVEINPLNIDQRLIVQAVNHLKKGGLLIFPTDTVYALGCDLKNKNALQSLAQIKGRKLNKVNFSIICSDLSHLSDYTRQLDRSVFKLLKHYLPGPFTFILNASNEVPKYFDSNKKEIGIRIPNNEITLEIVRLLGNPLATSSLHNDEDEIQEYFANPTVIYERFSDKIDFIIDGGVGKLEPSTIIDCSSGVAKVIRQGLGIFEN
jgi:tRNA threonylcarbamoyl adenosine modification protein (Sua5/YciO/YrdC/YwlC family)